MAIARSLRKRRVAKLVLMGFSVRAIAERMSGLSPRYIRDLMNDEDFDQVAAEVDREIFAKIDGNRRRLLQKAMRRIDWELDHTGNVKGIPYDAHVVDAGIEKTLRICGAYAKAEMEAKAEQLGEENGLSASPEEMTEALTPELIDKAIVFLDKSRKMFPPTVDITPQS